MEFPSALVRGTLIRRYRRFLADVDIDGMGSRTCHCPTPTSLRGCAEQGQTVYLSRASAGGRKYPYTWELSESDGALVAVNTPLCRRMLLEAVAGRNVGGLQVFDSMETDVTVGAHTAIDLLLQAMERNTFAHIFHVTWGEKGTALFPDAPAPRARTALRRLGELATGGHRAIAFFLIQRPDCTRIAVAREVDREISRVLLEAERSGVELMTYTTLVSTAGVDLGPPAAWTAA
jgi:sugar fermentation stimulation protein A